MGNRKDAGCYERPTEEQIQQIIAEYEDKKRHEECEGFLKEIFKFLATVTIVCTIFYALVDPILIKLFK